MADHGSTSPPPPPDRGGIATELRNERSMSLHTLSARACVALITREDEAVHRAMRAAEPAITALIEDGAPRFAAGGRLVYVGAGTSGRLGVLDASEAPPTFCVEPGRVVGIIAGGDAALRSSSEHMEDDPDGSVDALTRLGITKNDTVIGIASGGTTPYARGALSIAKGICEECCTGFLTCSPVPTPGDCDHMVLLDTGHEVLTGSTRMKAGTATKLALNTISTTLMVLSGRVHENLMVDLRATNDKLRDRAARIVSLLAGVDRETALRSLHEADGEAKTAIVMHRLGIGPDAARRALTQHHGRLGPTIGA